MDTRPIGMFDSGCGGLTVLKEYLKLMPNENYIYYGDTAHLPYGDKSKEKIIEFSRNIVEFLLSKNVKMIVIACGTASAQAFSTICKEYDIPIKNIITPTASSIKDENVGVIATKGTIKSNAWENAIKKYNPNSNVISLACPLFVPIVEEGFAKTQIADLAIKEYISKFKGTNITSLILGCTHYPILEEKIQKEIGNGVKLINAGVMSALDSIKYLKENNMQNLNAENGTREFFTSDDFELFKENAKQLGFEIE